MDPGFRCNIHQTNDDQKKITRNCKKLLSEIDSSLETIDQLRQQIFRTKGVLRFCYLVQWPSEDSPATNRPMFVNLRSYKKLISQTQQAMKRRSTSWYMHNTISCFHIPHCYPCPHIPITTHHQNLITSISLSHLSITTLKMEYFLHMI